MKLERRNETWILIASDGTWMLANKEGYYWARNKLVGAAQKVTSGHTVWVFSTGDNQ